MPIGPLFPASNVYVFAENQQPSLMASELLMAMTGSQLYLWQQTFRPLEPVFDMSHGKRPTIDNEGETEDDRNLIACELSRIGIYTLPPRWVEQAPVPTARQMLQHLYHSKG